MTEEGVPMSTAEPGPELTVHCRVCGTPAESFRIEASRQGGETVAVLVRELFSPFARTRIRPSQLEDAQRAIAAGDVRALNRVDPRWVSSWCPECDCCYCHDHWSQRSVSDSEGFYDFTEGTCPNGHLVELDD
jgi:hypothetical protein